MNKLALIFIASLCVINCENRSFNVEREEAAIYSVLIDEMATPLPPPPPPSKDGSKIEPIDTDSISKIKVEIVVDTVMFQSFKIVDINKGLPEYQRLVANIPSLEARNLKKKYISSSEGHTLIFGDSIEDSKAQYSQIIKISRIAFNEKKNMAAVYAGFSTHPLASSLNLFLLKKINGKWQIILEKTVEVS